MDIETLARSLQQQKLLGELSESHVAFLAGCTKNARFEEGSFLFREGDDADAVYILRKGKVSLEIYDPTRGTIVVETLGPGEVLGWSTIFPPHQWDLDGRAAKDTLAFSIDGHCLRRKLDGDHDFGYAFTRLMLREVHRRLERTRLQTLDVFRAAP
ncbi:MAG: cyclic nucleotide-binding domain-containing protein [Polyangiaceae bacterium]